ncbi:MAG: hypothetical protein GWO02_07015, partial [Gammaproteobacteria bacterium]|nr:hypothetical protein [Gammaproteobacteria bacterium]
PRVDLDATRERLERLGLGHAAERLEALLAETVKKETAPQAFLDRLLCGELEA